MQLTESAEQEGYSSIRVQGGGKAKMKYYCIEISIPGCIEEIVLGNNTKLFFLFFYIKCFVLFY